MTRAADLPVRGAPRRRGTHGWFDIAILDLDASATLFEYDDEKYMKRSFANCRSSRMRTCVVKAASNGSGVCSE